MPSHQGNGMFASFFFLVLVIVFCLIWAVNWKNGRLAGIGIPVWVRIAVAFVLFPTAFAASVFWLRWESTAVEFENANGGPRGKWRRRWMWRPKGSLRNAIGCSIVLLLVAGSAIALVDVAGGLQAGSLFLVGDLIIGLSIFTAVTVFACWLEYTHIWLWGRLRQNGENSRLLVPRREFGRVALDDYEEMGGDSDLGSWTDEPGPSGIVPTIPPPPDPSPGPGPLNPDPDQDTDPEPDPDPELAPNPPPQPPAASAQPPPSPDTQLDSSFQSDSSIDTVATVPALSIDSSQCQPVSPPPPTALPPTPSPAPPEQHPPDSTPPTPPAQDPDFDSLSHYSHSLSVQWEDFENDGHRRGRIEIPESNGGFDLHGSLERAGHHYSLWGHWREHVEEAMKIADNRLAFGRSGELAQRLGLTEGEVGALVVFSSEFPRLGPGDQPYRKLTQCLRERSPSELDVWGPFLWFLLHGVDKLEVHSWSEQEQNYLYRGVNTKAKNLEYYSMGKDVFWSSLTSTSTQRQKAERFLFDGLRDGGHGTFFIIKPTYAKDLTPFSQYIVEEERLLPINCKLHVNEEPVEEEVILHGNRGRARVTYVQLGQHRPESAVVWG